MSNAKAMFLGVPCPVLWISLIFSIISLGSVFCCCGLSSTGFVSSMSTMSSLVCFFVPLLLSMAVKFCSFARFSILFICFGDCVFAIAFTVGYCCFRKMCSKE